MKLQWIAAMLGAALAAAIVVPGCGNDDPTTADAGAGSGGSGGRGGDGAVSGPEASIGQFTLEMEAPRGATPTSAARLGGSGIVGTVGEKPQAEALIWEITSEAGGCTLSIPHVPSCAPRCVRQICVGTNTCESDRTLQDVGTVTLSGITTNDGAHDLALISVRNSYQNGLIEMPYPAFAAGDVITLSAAGGPSAPFNTPFTIDLTGTEVLVTPPVDYPLEAGMPLALTWTAAAEPSASHILVSLDISHHGGTKGKIECNVEDNGAFTIPAGLITELLALGVAGFPSVKITRSNSDYAQLENGRVHFVVTEFVELWIVIPGLISCTSTDQCPTNQTCHPDKTCS